jgi:hypothetical protein
LATAVAMVSQLQTEYEKVKIALLERLDHLSLG